MRGGVRWHLNLNAGAWSPWRARSFDSCRLSAALPYFKHQYHDVVDDPCSTAEWGAGGGPKVGPVQARWRGACGVGVDAAAEMCEIAAHTFTHTHRERSYTKEARIRASPRIRAYVLQCALEYPNGSALNTVHFVEQNNKGELGGEPAHS